MVGRGLALSVDAVPMEQIEVLSSSWSCTGVQEAPTAKCSFRVVYEGGYLRGPSGAPAAHRRNPFSLSVNHPAPIPGPTPAGESDG